MSTFCSSYASKSFCESKRKSKLLLTAKILYFPLQKYNLYSTYFYTPHLNCVMHYQGPNLEIRKKSRFIQMVGTQLAKVSQFAKRQKSDQIKYTEHIDLIIIKSINKYLNQVIKMHTAEATRDVTFVLHRILQLACLLNFSGLPHCHLFHLPSLFKEIQNILVSSILILKDLNNRNVTLTSLHSRESEKAGNISSYFCKASYWGIEQKRIRNKK